MGAVNTGSQTTRRQGRRRRSSFIGAGGAIQPHRPTMRDVAAEAGVGLTTVSRVVSGNGPVSPQTVLKVQRAIEMLGFRRDEIARSLRPGQNSLTIGLLLGDLTNPFWSRLAKGALSVLEAAGYASLVATVDEEPQRARHAVETLMSRRVAGLIVVPETADQRFLGDGHGGSHVPVVFVDRPARGVETDVVTFDNEGGGLLATRHLIQHRHRRIAILVAPAYYTTGRRLRGYRRAMRGAGLEPLVVPLEEGSVAAAATAARRLLTAAAPPTAFFSTTNFLTEGVLAAVGRQHRSVAIVGFDDFRLADRLPTPVTVVATDIEGLGRQAAEILLQRIDGDHGPARRVILPVSLVERGSGELSPAR